MVSFPALKKKLIFPRLGLDISKAGLVYFWLVLAYMITMIGLYFMFSLVRVIWPNSTIAKLYSSSKEHFGSGTGSTGGGGIMTA